MYSIKDLEVNYFLRYASHIYACTHPSPQFMVMVETSTFGIFHGQNVRSRNVRAEMSVAEMSVAEMSYIHQI